MTPSGLPTLPEDEVRRRLAAELPAWTYDGLWLRRDAPTASRAGALMLANRIAFLAEAARHHPDLEIRPGSLRIRIRHHWAAGITESDLALARAVEKILEERGAAGAGA